MRLRVVLRQVHHWSSVVLAVPLLIMIGAGVLLMLKKESAWIQPPSVTGVKPDAVPMAGFDALFEAARSVEQAGITSWPDLARVDVKPGKGIAKFVSVTNWEVQVDTHTASVLRLAYRRSDIIEAIHDGSYFGPWVKLGLFLPTGVLLFIMWATGIYLFALPHLKRAAKRRRRQRPHSASPLRP